MPKRPAKSAGISQSNSQPPPLKKQRRENNDKHNHNNNKHDDELEIIQNNVQKVEQKHNYKLKDIKTWTCDAWIAIIRIVHKSTLELINHQGKRKNFFYIIIADTDGTLRKMTFWQEEALKWTKSLSIGAIYQLERATVRNEQNRLFSHWGKEYFSCNVNTVFIKQEKSNHTILKQVWDPIENIAELNNVAEYTVVDVIGFVMDIGETETVKLKRGGTTRKRTFELADRTAKIKVTAWGPLCGLDIKKSTVIGIKKARVSKYMSCCLDVVGFIQKNPIHNTTDELKQWADEQQQSVYNLLRNVSNITDPTAIRINSNVDWDAAAIKSIPWLSYQCQLYKETQTLPEETVYKIKASVKNIDGKMWFARGGKHRWRLKLTLCDKNKKWFKATAWDQAASALMGGSADEATKLNQKELSDKIEALLDGSDYLFCISMKENDYFSPMRLEFIIDDVKKF